MKVSKRFLDRARPALRRYQKLLESARTRDVNESDTVVIVNDFLQDVLGYDKYQDVTTEFAIRSTFCDLAIKIGGTLRFLIEVKSAGTDLRENHLRQAVDYAANQGVEWVLLTNGACWQAYRIRFEQPIQHDSVFDIDLLAPESKPGHLLERLYLISREAHAGGEIDQFWRRKEATNRFVIAQFLLDPSVARFVRRQLRKLFKGVKITEAEIAATIRDDVLKRDVIEGERAQAAARIARRGGRKKPAKPPADEPSVPDAATEPPSPRSIYEERGLITLP